MVISLKRKLEPAIPTPAKMLKADAALRMRTWMDDVNWLARVQVATERRKAEESAVPVGSSAQEGAGSGDAAHALG